MLKLYVFCGPPASGKTTMSLQLSEERQFIRYSFDEMKCFKHSELIHLIISTFQKGRSSVVDAVYGRVEYRKQLLESIKDINCEKILIYMNTPLEECIRRNAERPNPLPVFIVEDIYNSFEPPTLDEGWDKIIYIKDGDCYESNIRSN